MFAPLKRGPKIRFDTTRAIMLAEEGKTIQQIADALWPAKFASIRHYFVNNNIKYSKGKLGRPKKESSE